MPKTIKSETVSTHVIQKGKVLRTQVPDKRTKRGTKDSTKELMLKTIRVKQYQPMLYKREDSTVWQWVLTSLI